MSIEENDQKAYTKHGKLVDGLGLLEVMFEERSRPSLLWLHTATKRRTIPHIKLGRLVRYDVDAVRQALEARITIRART